MVVAKELLVAIDFHRMGKNTLLMSGYSQLITNILQNNKRKKLIQLWNKWRVGK